MKIEEIAIDKIQAYAGNSKEHPESQIAQIIESINEFGFNDPIAIDETGTIIEGHGRYEAIKRLGWNKVPVIRLKHLDEKKKKAYIIAHNKLTLNTGFNLEKLTEELDFLKSQDYNLTHTGFDMDELDALLNVENPEDIEDDYYTPDIPEDPKSKAGDLWNMGPHKLLCGSSTSEWMVNQLLGDERIDLTLTDPPYNVNYQSGSTGMTIDNDHYDNNELFGDFIEQFYTVTADKQKPGTPIYVFHADQRWEFRDRLERTDFLLKQILVWVKHSFTFGRADYHWRHEPIIYGWKKGESHKWYGSRDKDTVIDDTRIDYKNLKKEELIELLKHYREGQATDTVIYNDKPSFNDIHPTMKPIKLLAKLIVNSSKPGDIVYDGFAGSGSTMIAADKLGRVSRNIELDPAYVDSVVARWVKHAGAKDVTLERDGKTYTYRDIFGGDE